ncbi:MAG: hypothetical protein ACK55I_40355, partial [bacterium]
LVQAGAERPIGGAHVEKAVDQLLHEHESSKRPLENDRVGEGAHKAHQHADGDHVEKYPRHRVDVVRRRQRLGGHLVAGHALGDTAGQKRHRQKHEHARDGEARRA